MSFRSRLKRRESSTGHRSTRWSTRSRRRWRKASESKRSKGWAMRAARGPASSALGVPVVFFGTRLVEDNWLDSDESVRADLLVAGAATLAFPGNELGTADKGTPGPKERGFRDVFPLDARMAAAVHDAARTVQGRVASADFRPPAKLWTGAAAMRTFGSGTRSQPVRAGTRAAVCTAATTRRCSQMAAHNAHGGKSP
jgi:hypothetical protein